MPSDRSGHMRAWRGTFATAPATGRSSILLGHHIMSKHPPATNQASASVARVLLSVKETRQRLGLSHSKVYDLIRDGKLPSALIGRKRVVRAADLDAFVAGLGR